MADGPVSTLQRALAATMIVVGAGVAVYGGAGYLASTGEAFAGLLLVLFAAPAVPPVMLGVLMLRGRRWAAVALRWYLLALLAIGAWLHLGVGLRVFAPPSFGVLVVGACLAWVALSLRAERRPGSPAAPR